MGEFKKGLEDVVAGESSICFIDGQAGVLAYRGIGIDELGERASFEEVVHLLFTGSLPDRRSLEGVRRAVGSSRELPAPVVAALRGALDRNPMSVLRTAVSLLGTIDPDAEDGSREALLRKGYRLVGQVGSTVAAFERLRRGLEPVAPNPELSAAEAFLHEVTGERPDPVSARIFDRCLVLHADHELNASTFAARVTAATLADLHSAVVSAIGALKGPLHGGANTAVMEVLKEIGAPDRVEPWLDEALAGKRRIMGFGHRVYKTEDPRATQLRQMSRELAEARGPRVWYDLSERLERAMRERKGLRPNVDFYSASVYHMLGIPGDLFTPIFAASRIAGWVAHCLEQYGDNRLIRPRAAYTGPTGARYAPLEER
jgi:citrate synthase